MVKGAVVNGAVVNGAVAKWRRSCAGALLLVLASAVALPVAAEPLGPADAFLEAVIEPREEPPFEQEMVLLKIRGFYRANLALVSLEQPPAKGYGWMQLGRDRWYDATVNGRQGRGFEQIIAIFPQRSGMLQIGAFVHRLTVVARDGSRFTQEVRTAPVTLEVRPKPAHAGWWLPASEVSVADSWDRPPDQLAFGQSARRTVTLEAKGVGPELLPPIPSMRSPGVIAFADPEERATELTPEGPVSRVTWSWVVKPLSDAAAVLEAVTIPWYDTSERRPREVVLDAQRVALARAAGAAPADDPFWEALARHSLPIGVLGGFACGLLLLIPGLQFKSRSELSRLGNRLSPHLEVLSLRRVAWRGDAHAVRQAARRLVRRDQEPGRSESRVDAHLAALDRSLFGPDAGGETIDLRGFVTGLLAARRSL